MRNWLNLIICKLSRSHKWSNWNTVSWSDVNKLKLAKKNDYELCVETRICTRCAKGDIHVTGHSWSEWKRKADCSNETHECARCGKKQSRLLGHSWGEWRLVKGLCEETRECTHCATREKRGLAHTWGEWRLVKGLCEETRECAHCAAREKRVAHTWREWGLVKGLCEETRECAHCTAKEERTADHIWSDWDDKGLRVCSHCSSTENRSSITCGRCRTVQPSRSHLILIQETAEWSDDQPNPNDISRSSLYCLSCAKDRRKRKGAEWVNEYEGIQGYKAVWQFVEYLR